jgi:predicted Zn-dependent protease
MDRRKTIDAQTVLPVFLLALAIAGVIAAADVILVRFAGQHRTETAARVYERALEARNAGKVQEALELFRRSFNESPANPRYQLAFAQALRAAGRVAESRAALERLLAEHPAHGGANAEMARILASHGDWQNAAWYYHRALYGEWNDKPDLRQLRFELAGLLANNGAREQLLAEVVLLTSEPLEPDESRRLAQLLLAAEDWTRAERQYRSLLREEPNNPHLLVGLARAQMGTGRYIAAERTFRRAAQAGGIDEAAGRELKLLQTVNGMDPTVRGLSGQEKHRRAHAITAQLAAALKECSGNNPLVQEVELALSRHGRVRNPVSAAEADLELFDQLLAARSASCKIPRELQLLGEQLSK